MIQKDLQELEYNITKIKDGIFFLGQVKGTQKQGKYYYYIESKTQYHFAGFYENDQKIDFWKEIYEERKRKPLIFCGQYVQGQRNGKWAIYYDKEIIGGGLYIDDKKTGPWIDVEISQDQRDLIFNQGSYENGIRKGSWIVYNYQQRLYGGGFYNENGQKEGDWIDYQYVFFFGKYKNGLPIGEWKNHDGTHIGLYDDNGKKQGFWNELNAHGKYIDDKRVGLWTLNEFSLKNWVYYKDGLKTLECRESIREHDVEIFGKGEYNKGKRIGEWEFTGDGLTGKGTYDNNGLKQGKWTDIVVLGGVEIEGHYKDDKRTGKWESKQGNMSGEYIDGLKQGEWMEFNKKIIYKNGFPDIEQLFEKENQSPKPNTFLLISENGKSRGVWIFSQLCIDLPSIKGAWIYKKTQQKRYGLDLSLKSGVYIFYDDETYYLTGKAKYGMQTANQIEIEKFQYETQEDLKYVAWEDKSNINLISKYSTQIFILNCENLQTGPVIEQIQYEIYIYGYYLQGFRIGKWTIFQIKYQQLQIGGGYYENGFKNGYWIESDEIYDMGHEVTYRGEYKDERRIGMWKIFYQNIDIGGGGLYGEYGFKQGEWIEPSDYFNFSSQFTEQGIYKDGIRVGEWKVLFKRKKIGGGFYNEIGKKEGKWIEADNYSFLKKQYTFENLTLRTFNYINGICQEI